MDARQVALDLIFEDEDDDDYLAAIRRPKLIKERLDHFEDLDDIEFAKRFRLSKRSSLQVLDLIDHRLEFPSDKNYAISPISQLLLCLMFYATGCTQLSAGDFSGVSESSANRIVHRVTAATASLYQHFVYFPRSAAEIRATQREFHSIASFPKVIGAVDCTHIKIRSPGGNNAEYFRNRKGFMSINCQGICNANLEFLDVVARWPGSSHDQTIFESCQQRALLESNHYGGVILLGDSAYSDKRYMMTPLAEVNTAAENLYNESQIRTRNPIERVFGVWKRRFPILAVGINVRLEKALPIIIATSDLHNILRRNGDPPPPDGMLELPIPWEALLEQGQVAPANNQPRNRRPLTGPFRQAMIKDYFQTLHVMHQNQV